MLFFCSKFLVLCHVTTLCLNITVEVMGRPLQDNYHTCFIGGLRWSYFSSYDDATVELRLTKCQGTVKICLLYRGFFISKTSI